MNNGICVFFYVCVLSSWMLSAESAIQLVGSTNQTLSSLTGNATLSCTFTSDVGGLSVVWLRNSVALSSAEKYVITSAGDSQDGVTSNLTITNVNITDAGSYVCRATDQSQVSYPTIVSILVKPIERGDTVDFYRLPVGSNLRITCAALGYPLPKVIWRRRNINLSNTTYNISSSQYNITTTLSLINVNYTERAIYSCIFTNEAGNHTEKVDVRIISNLAPLWPAVGILIQITIAGIAYITYRPIDKRKKAN